MNYIHINRARADTKEDLWCPYCDDVVAFGHQNWYDDWWCTKCNRWFPHQHQWPKGFDIKTGKLKKPISPNNRQDENMGLSLHL